MTATRKFTRLVEDFSCLHCGAAVTGSGYTDHCPKCLWSRHVDVFPGDRAEECAGMMRPVGLEKSGERYRLTEQCERCGFERASRLRPEDDFEVALALSRDAADQQTKTNRHVVEGIRDRER